MKYSEFYDSTFINQNYIFRFPSTQLNPYIDFYWESDYNPELQLFTMRSFPRIGSTLLFNIKGSFRFCKGTSDFTNEDHIYYQRNQVIETTHQANTKIFGVQFKINLPLLNNPVNSGNYRTILKANHLFDSGDMRRIIALENLDARINHIESHVLNRLTKKTEHMATIVNAFIGRANDSSKTSDPMSYFIPYSSKTLERYFKICTGTTPKKAILIQKTRTALIKKFENKPGFNCIDFGFYDESHFYKCVRNLKSGY